MLSVLKSRFGVRVCVCVCSVELAGTGQRKSRFSKQRSNKVPNASGYLIEVWQGENRLLRGSEGLIASIRRSQARNGLHVGPAKPYWIASLRYSISSLAVDSYSYR